MRENFSSPEISCRFVTYVPMYSDEKARAANKSFAGLFNLGSKFSTELTATFALH